MEKSEMEKSTTNNTSDHQPQIWTKPQVTLLRCQKTMGKTGTDTHEKSGKWS